jgi:hypothetical protein
MTRALLLASTVCSVAAAAPLAWTACRTATDDCCAAVIPGTALHTLLGNGTFNQPQTSLPLRDPYVDTWLRDAIPDINETGPAWWAFAYSATVHTSDISGCSLPYGTAAFAVASLEQGSYRLRLSLDGVLVPPASGNETDAKGMFRRFDWVLGPAASFCGAATHELQVSVSPPDHPGAVTGGQGGDHLLSQDLISQDLAGWDWVAGVPDREWHSATWPWCCNHELRGGTSASLPLPPAGNTGLFDPFFVSIAPSGVLLRDPAVVVTALQRSPSSHPGAPVPLSAFVCVSIMPLSNASQTGTLVATINGTDFTTRISIEAGSAGTWLEFSTGVVAVPAARLWWPHTAGEPWLYDAVATYVPDAGGPGVEAQWRAGFRVVQSAVDEGLGGQVFYVNGERVFLQVSDKEGWGVGRRCVWCLSQALASCMCTS